MKNRVFGTPDILRDFYAPLVLTGNPAHKSFKEEWEIIKNFYNYIDKLLKDGNNKWLL